MPLAIESLISSMEWAAENSVSDYSFELEGRQVTLTRAEGAAPQTVSSQTVSHQPASDTVPTPAAEAPAPDLTPLTAPLSGLCYLAQEGGSAPFVKVGDAVRKGQTLCLIEAMKVMTSVTAECDGTLVELCVEDGATVEAGAPLMKVRA